MFNFCFFSLLLIQHSDGNYQFGSIKTGETDGWKTGILIFLKADLWYSSLIIGETQGLPCPISQNQSVNHLFCKNSFINGMCITKIYNIYVFIYLEYMLSYLQTNLSISKAAQYKNHKYFQKLYLRNLLLRLIISIPSPEALQNRFLIEFR